MKHSDELQRLKVLNEDASRATEEFYELAERTIVRLIMKKGVKDDEGDGYTFEDLGDMCCMHTTLPSNDEMSGSGGSEFSQSVERIEADEDGNAILLTEVGEFDIDDFERDDVIDLIEYLESYTK